MSNVDTSAIQAHSEVVGSDHEHVGTVDHLEGTDTIKLTKKDSDADGQHHYIPTSWVESVQDNKVTLSITAAEAQQRWENK